MPIALDPQIDLAMAALQASRGDEPLVAAQDVQTLRGGTNAGLAAAFSRLPDAPNVTATDFFATGVDGGEIPLRWYEKKAGGSGSAVVYAHGGGMVCGSLAIYDRLVRLYVELSGVPFLSVDYRLAPEFSDTGLALDVRAAAEWLMTHSGSLGVDPLRVALMGDSAGGGLAAAAAIMARDCGITLRRQILIYPMLDDRNIEAKQGDDTTALWSHASNRLAWDAVIGSRLPSSYIAPARGEDFSGLAGAYLEVGELDIFRDEVIAYAERLSSADVSCELHVHAGAPHGYDIMDINFDVCRRAMADRIRVLRAL
jgi:acetyl esterase/lipase